MKEYKYLRLSATQSEITNLLNELSTVGWSVVSSSEGVSEDGYRFTSVILLREEV